MIVVLVALTVTVAGRLFMENSIGRPGPDDTAAATYNPSASTDRLISGLQSRLNSRPEDAYSYSMLGSAYSQKARESGEPGYYSRAEGAFGRALALDPQDFQAMTGMGTLALSRHEFQQALEWGEQALSINPHDAHIYGVIGDALVELGRYEEAWDSFQKMIELRPDLSSYSRVSYARELNGDVPGAIEAMKRALKAGGPNAENTNWTRVQLGNLHFDSGDLSAAEAEYVKALELFPGYVHAEAGLAKVLAARGEHAQAIDMYQGIIEKNPLPEYVIALGDVHTAAGHAGEAEQVYALVRLQQKLYRVNGVNTDLEMALFDADHNQNLEVALDRAHREYQRRPSIWAADALAWTLHKNGDYQKALGYAQEALKLGKKDALMFFHSGMINFELGNRQEARSLLRQALSLNPHFSLLYGRRAVQTLKELEGGPAVLQTDRES